MRHVARVALVDRTAHGQRPRGTATRGAAEDQVGRLKRAQGQLGDRIDHGADAKARARALEVAGEPRVDARAHERGSILPAGYGAFPQTAYLRRQLGHVARARTTRGSGASDVDADLERL